jgi:hypothetical protein
MILARATNVLSVIHPHVYFPSYSNGLKEIGQFLGFQRAGRPRDWMHRVAQELE